MALLKLKFLETFNIFKQKSKIFKTSKNFHSNAFSINLDDHNGDYSLNYITISKILKILTTAPKFPFSTP
jgi:hypothetical protein